AFKYSLEENTAAYDMHPRIADRISESRHRKIMSLQQKISQHNAERYLNSVQEVLVEEKDAFRNIYIGRSKHHAPDDIDGHIRFTSEKELEPGTFVNVLIEEVNAYDWKGKAL
ncbi:MAG: TRAM domain-containing protein, partial [Erysipelotrichaceae bacterium]|nr:TRAM domain-containing protein [Erysipelotrichaceae bacterium]